jgi:hypothetical protein
MDPNSIAADRHVRTRRPNRMMQIRERLALGPATTRMLAQEFGCQSSDLTKAVFDLRERGMIFDAGGGRDPITGRWVHFWTTKPPTAKAAGGG